MTIHKTMTAKQIHRLKTVMPAVLKFIEANVPEDVRRTKVKHGFERYREAMAAPLNTSEGLTYRGSALLWAIGFLMEHREGCSASAEIVHSFELLAELGLMSAEPQAPISSAVHWSRGGTVGIPAT